MNNIEGVILVCLVAERLCCIFFGGLVYLANTPGLQPGANGSNPLSSTNFGLKVFMDAHDTVTVEEGDRYPLRPPSYGEAGACTLRSASVIHQVLG